MSRQLHTIPPVYNACSEVLILGSFPSVRSRETGFFYGHPQNRFWKVLTEICGWPAVPETIPQKQELLLTSHIALWDVIASCEITGSSDASIRNIVPNDLRSLLSQSQIRAIYCNGTTAYRLCLRYLDPEIHLRPVLLPSTSPANAAWTLPKLADAWRIVTMALQKNAP